MLPSSSDSFLHLILKSRSQLVLVTYLLTFYVAAGIESSQDCVLRILKTVRVKWLRVSVDIGGRVCWNGVILLQKIMKMHVMIKPPFINGVNLR
jgi:hypothetical protein